ncbi:MAG: Holliday junction resolvase RuvX [Aquificota bacterium]|nr:Holliday junction resolvase RuvX [Aquificota bacterium]
MKVLTVDYGTKFIGLAVGDTELKVAVPKGRIRGGEGAPERIARIVEESGVERVIVGLPLTPSGREGRRAEEVRRFVDRLRETLPGVDIQLWDERYTTEEALRRLSGLPPKKRKELKDEIAALVILEEYLQSL